MDSGKRICATSGVDLSGGGRQVGRRIQIEWEQKRRESGEKAEGKRRESGGKAEGKRRNSGGKAEEKRRESGGKAEGNGP